VGEIVSLQALFHYTKLQLVVNLLFQMEYKSFHLELTCPIVEVMDFHVEVAPFHVEHTIFMLEG